MRHVRMTLDADGREAEIHEMYDLLANAPFVDTARTTHWNFSGDQLGIMHYVEGDAGAFRDAAESIGEVHDFELTRIDGESFYAYLMCETTPAAKQLFGTLTRGRLVLVPPLAYQPDGSVSIALVGPSAEIQAAIDGVPDPVSVQVEEIGGLDRATDAVESLLSDRQREAIQTALELGYYEIPRAASHEDVADQIGCAPSTAAEHLRKAESTLLESLLA